MINVKDDFGALGDGSADDTKAIQQAIKAAQEKGLALFMPAGVYLVSHTLETLPSDMPGHHPLAIRGEGLGLTTIQATNRFHGVSVFASRHVRGCAGSRDRFEFRDFGVHGNSRAEFGFYHPHGLLLHPPKGDTKNPTVTGGEGRTGRHLVAASVSAAAHVQLNPEDMRILTGGAGPEMAMNHTLFHRICVMGTTKAAFCIYGWCNDYIECEMSNNGGEGLELPGGV